MSGAYYYCNIQIISCGSAKITLNNGISAKAFIYMKWPWVGYKSRTL